MNELATFLASLMSIVFILFLLLWRFRAYRTDAFRQIMFQLRDELFDEARKGTINFDDDAYIMLRSAINNFIRFGHKLNLIQVILLHITLKAENYTSEPFLEKLKKNCADEQEEIIISYYMRMNDHIIEHLILSSYILLLIMSITFMLVVPILPLLAAKKQIEKLENYFIGVIDKLDLEKFENMPA